jgi:type I restriction enzyme S subunit
MSGWATASLGEIFDIARGGSPRPIDAYVTDDPKGINWVMIGDAKEGSKYITSTKKRIRLEGAQRSRRVKPGDFLLTNSMSFGKPYIMRTDGCIHDGWLALSPRNGNVDPDFFYHLLGSKALYSEFERRASGATVKNLNIDLVRGVTVPLPPIPEQRRIADILDKADALRVKRHAALAKLDELTQSIFLDMFGDPATNPKGWSTATLDDVSLGGTEGLKRGPFGGALKKEIFVDTGYKVYEQQHAIYKEFRTGTYFVSEPKFRSMSTFAVVPGDFIVSCSGTVGRIYRLPHSAPDGIINQALLRIRVDEQKVIPAFFEALFETTEFQRELLGAARGTGIHNFPPMQRVRATTVILPPLEQQLDFQLKLEAIQSLRASHLTWARTMEDCFASIQDLAFRGEL